MLRQKKLLKDRESVLVLLLLHNKWSQTAAGKDTNLSSHSFLWSEVWTAWLGSMFRTSLADIKVLAICTPIWRVDQGEICCKPLLVVGRNSFPVALRLRSLLSCNQGSFSSFWGHSLPLPCGPTHFRNRKHLVYQISLTLQISLTSAIPSHRNSSAFKRRVWLA